MASNHLDHIVDCADRCIIVGKLSDYWIIKTDYSNFAVVYICSEEKTDGTCGNAKAWVYSRHHGLTHDLMAEADRQLERVCMDTTLFYTTQRIQSKSSIIGCTRICSGLTQDLTQGVVEGWGQS